MPKTIAMPRPIGATLLVFLLTLLAVAFALPAASVAAPEGSGEPLTLSPATGGLPKTTVGTQSSAQEFDVANNGGEGVDIGSVKLEAGDTSDFNLGSNCGGTLSPGQHCTLWITFVPSSVGEKQATLAIHFNDGRPDQLLALSGSAVSPQLAFTPDTYDFGIRWVNSGSDTTFQLANTGEAPVQVGNLDVIGDSGSFGTGSSDCWGRWLQPSETCAVQVWFNPHDTVAYSAQLRANTNGFSFTADLSGAGGRAIVEPSSNPVDFGSAAVGTFSPVRAITLTNSGDLPGAFFIAVIAGGASGSFDLVDEDCTSTPVMPAASCTVNVRFSPQGVGVKSARLALFGEGEGGTMVMLTGAGTASATPAMTLMPSSIDFGRQTIGTKSSGHYLSFHNDGAAPVELGSAAIVGDDLDQFKLAGDTCSGTILAAGGECLLRVRFTPDSTGAKAATLRIDGEEGALSASLAGLGIARRGVKSSGGSRHPNRLQRRFRHGTALSVSSARCYAHRCRMTVSPRAIAKGD